MGKKALEDTDLSLIESLAPLAAALPSQTPDSVKSSFAAPEGQVTTQHPALEAKTPRLEPPATSSEVALRVTSEARTARNRIAKRSYTLPEYVEAQIHERAYVSGLSKTAVVLKALKADGFAVRDEDIRDKRKRI